MIVVLSDASYANFPCFFAAIRALSPISLSGNETNPRMVSPCCPKDMLTVLSRICLQVLTVAAAVEAAVEAEEEEW